MKAPEKNILIDCGLFQGIKFLRLKNRKPLPIDEKTIDETYRKMLFDRLFEYLETQFTIQDKKVGEEEFFKLQDPHTTHHHH